MTPHASRSVKNWVSTKNFDAYLEVNSGAEKTRLAVLEEEQRNSVEAIIMPATPAPTAQAPAAQVQSILKTLLNCCLHDCPLFLSCTFISLGSLSENPNHLIA